MNILLIHQRKKYPITGCPEKSDITSDVDIKYNYSRVNLQVT